MSFDELGLSDKVLQAVGAAGYSQPTPIQTQAIPHVLARRDVLGIAQTGTGKTAAFTLPMLTMLETGRARARMPRTLILEPTRELAAQVEENFVRYGVNHKLSVALLIGGVSFGDQDVKITRGVDVLIATPGRLLDHFERGKLLLTGVELLVIDEADRMLDMGFIPDIERIVKLTPFTRQTLFFSATMPPEIQRLSEKFLSNPVKVEVARPASAAQTITQRLVSTGSDPAAKRETLRGLIRDAVDLQNAIIFCNRKRDVAVLHRSLQRHKFNAVALHGDMDQRARMLALESFRTGEATILVASDVAARGLDIPMVSHVFNYDVPHHAEDYVHRIGRTGRAGRSGAAFTLVAPGDERSLSAIEKLIGNAVVWSGPTTAEAGHAPARPSRERGPRRGGGRGEAEEAPSRSRRGGRRESAGEARAAEPQAVRAPAPEREPAEPRREPKREPQREPQREPRREPRREPQRDAERTARPARGRARREEEQLDTPSFGDHIPAFLLRPVVIKSKK
ncbi:DEAD/DEAH box helicase [Salinarimonas rosea]|uniref:DEAD/DEAH box helicase n=1 Tax=Salinarimonas rosea TaxID=552063 RepID=UPI00048BA96A|nr:DEAD/DEAH box helicase [Salinarimonas rosea]